jgi:hypothetical protein
MAHQEDKPTIESTTEARAGVTGHNVRGSTIADQLRGRRPQTSTALAAKNRG